MQLAKDLRSAITGMAEPSALDMGDFACALAHTLRDDYGASAITMLPGGHPARFYSKRGVVWHFSIARPERSLRIEARRVLVEDKRRVAVSFFSGAWTDFERQIKIITRNLLKSEEGT